jgi:hypothetical protein
MVGKYAPAPNNVSVKPEIGGVHLQWQPVPGSDGYRIYWEKEKSVDVYSPRLADVPPDRLQYDAVGLSAGVKYRFRIATLKGSSRGPLSIEVGAEPKERDKSVSSDAAP